MALHTAEHLTPVARNHLPCMSVNEHFPASVLRVHLLHCDNANGSVVRNGATNPANYCVWRCIFELENIGCADEDMDLSGFCWMQQHLVLR